MNEQFLQMLYQWQQQQNQPFNINTNTTLPNNQMQPFTQQVWRAPEQNQWNNSEDFSYSPQQDPLQNSMSQIPENAGMYSDAQTGQVVNFDASLFNPQQSNNNNTLSYLNAFSRAFAPVSTETSTFKLGQSIAFNNNNPYASQQSRNANTVRGIAAGGATLASLLRTGLQGAAYQNVQNDSMTNYFNRQNQQDFVPLSSFENGGEIDPPVITVTDRNDPRYRAYQDSLNAYNSTAKDVINAKRYINTTGKGEYISGVFSNDQRVKPIGAYFGIDRQSVNVYAKPNQRVVLDTTPPVTATNLISQPLIQSSGIPQSNIINQYPSSDFQTFGTDRFQNIARAQGNITSTDERRNNPEWNKDVQMIFLKDPATLGINRQNSGRYAVWNDSYNNLKEGEDYVFMEDGGVIPQEQYLTGSYIGENQSQGRPTAEVEGGEYVQSPQGNVQQVIGDSHKQGGVDLALEQGSKVISDNLKLGGKNAREIKRQFGIEVKANNTFADAIDKYKNKIGLNKLDKEQEGLFKKLEDKTGLEDQQTNAINEQYLATQIQETELAKDPLNEQLASFTDELFQKQEELKGNTTELQFENGGTYTGNQLKDLAKKHNLTEEQASEIITSLKEYADGGIIPSQYGLPEYGNQPQTTPGLYGNVSSANYGERVAEIQNLHPEIYAQIFDSNGQLREGKTWADYQRAVNDNYANILSNYAQLYGETSPEYQNLSSQVRNQMFVEGDTIRGYDSKAGNFTLSRPNFSVDIIPQDELQRLRQQGINTSSQLRAQNPELYKKYVESNNLKGDFYLGAVPTTAIGQNQTTEEANNTQINIPRTPTNQFAGLDLIDQTLPAPSPLQPNRMPDAQYRNYEATLLGYESQVQALYNQETAAVNQLNGLSPAQRAAALTQISASVQDNVGQVIGQTNVQNQQELARTSNMNTQLFNQYGIIDNQERDLYEQRAFQALNNQEQSLNNWYQYNNQVNALNTQQNNQARTLSSLFQNVTLDSNGQVVLNGVTPQLLVQNGIIPNTVAPTQASTYNKSYAQARGKADAKR